MMTPDKELQQSSPEPRGFGEHTRGLAGEYAHELGWGLLVEERTKRPVGPQDTDGGTDYDYGARDFGDEAVHVSAAAEPTDQPEGERSLTISSNDDVQ